MSLKEANEVVNKKIYNTRLKSSHLKQALMKKYRKAITEKIIAIFEHNYSNVT